MPFLHTRPSEQVAFLLKWLCMHKTLLCADENYYIKIFCFKKILVHLLTCIHVSAVIYVLTNVSVFHVNLCYDKIMSHSLQYK